MKHFEFVDQFKHVRKISYIIYSVYIIFTYIVSNIFGSNCTYFCGLSSFNPYDLHRKLETHSRLYNVGGENGERRKMEERRMTRGKSACSLPRVRKPDIVKLSNGDCH